MVLRFSPILAALAATALTNSSAWAQAPTSPVAADPAPVVAAPPPLLAPPPTPVTVQALPTLDFFSPGAGDAGLPADLWARSSGDLARQTLPILGVKPLTPAFTALARRLLSTGASGPDGAGNDAEVAAARAGAILALGDPASADAILSHTTGIETSAALSQVAAEAALILGQDDKACRIGQALIPGRQTLYWLRLRGYCQAIVGDKAAAQLTLDLAEAQGRDLTFRRLMTVVINGGGPPGAAALRNGMDYALSRRLALDLAPALATAPLAIRNRINPPAPPPPAPPAPAGLTGIWDLIAAADPGKARALRAGLERSDAAGLTALELALADAALTTQEGKPNAQVLDQLVERGGQGDPKGWPRAQAAAALYAALGPNLSPQGRTELAGFALGRGESAARAMAMVLAAEAGAKGDTALYALTVAADAGASGPPIADRALIVRALRLAGLGDEARAIALEGLLDLRPSAAGR